MTGPHLQPGRAVTPLISSTELNLIQNRKLVVIKTTLYHHIVMGRKDEKRTSNEFNFAEQKCCLNKSNKGLEMLKVTFVVRPFLNSQVLQDDSQID